MQCRALFFASHAGSLFELIGDKSPQFGFAPTAGLVVVGFPVCILLFYAAIRKAMVETEEDDKAFLGNKKQNW
jgi:Na+/melibiose symporter-like transporter